MSTERAITLLHLSDLQFGPYHRFESAGELGSLLERLREDLDRLVQAQGLKPDLILLTGDLTEFGKKSELDQVHQFAQRLAKLVEVPTRNVVLVPGNHDINRKLCEAYFSQCEGNEVQPEPPYWPKLQHYADFFARFYEGEPAIRFTPDESWSFFVYPELKVVVAGLNSTMADSHRKEDHYGFLGERQLRAMAEKLRPYKEQGFLRIGAVHHDVLHPQNDAARQDFKDLKRILGPYLNVILHGHIHEEQLEWLDNTVPVLCIGSAGLSLGKRAPEVPNQYQIVQVIRSGLRFGSRAYVPDQKRWVGDVRADPKGQAWLVDKKVTFERVDEAFSGGPVEAAPARDLARVVESYRRHVVLDRQRSLSDLIGFGEDRDVPGGLDLLRIFVPQSVALRLADLGPAPESTQGVDITAQREATPPGEYAVAEVPEGALDRMVVEPVDQVLTDPLRPWVLLLGDPGAGKTAITRWLALALTAAGERPDRLPDNLVPVRIEMRRFNEAYARASQRPYDFFAYLDEVHGEMSLSLRGDFLRELASAGRLLWLFDGMDEVPSAHDRRRYAAMIAGLKAEYVGCRGLITSRIVGSAQLQKVLGGAGVPIGMLLKFDDGQMDLFLDRWHDVAFPGGPDTGRRRRERLALALAESPALRDLAGNPLLLTMIAYLNRDEELPRRRHLLYQRTIERMADQWDANKQLSPSSSAIRFSLAHKTRFLRQLAWQMMNDEARGQNNAIHERALHKFAAHFCEQTFGEEPDVARSTADELLQHLRERNYVLTLLGGQLFGFVHKSFLEYLVATEMHARFRSHEWEIGEIGQVFQNHWHEESWTDTLTLVCGILDEDRPEQVVEVLQKAVQEGGNWSGIKRVSYVAFAIRCLAEISRIEQEPSRSFAVRLTSLLEHEIAAIDTLGQGPTADPVLPALRLHTGRWPGFEQLCRWAKEGMVVGRSISYTSAYQCAMAAGGRGRRLNLLRDALSTDRIFIGMVIREASALGAWTREEIDALLEASVSKSDVDKVLILSSILFKSSDDDVLIQVIARLAEYSEDEQARFQAAFVLFAVNREHELAERVLSDLLQSSELSIRYDAARTLASVGLGSKAIQVLVECLAAVPLLAGASAEALLWLAATDPAAERALDELGQKLDGIESNEALAAICSNIAVAGLTDIAERALSKRLDAQPDADGMLRIASAMVLLPGTQAKGLQVLDQRYDSTKTEEIGSVIVSRLLNLQKIGGAAEQLLMKIMVTATEDTLRASAARTILSRSTDAEIHTAAQQTLTMLTRPEVDERARLQAAHGLGPEQSNRVFSDLARSATSGTVRMSAAHAVRDPAVLTELARSTQDEQVRREANVSLTSLKLLKALLQVGKPRRGRVRLSGRPVGILEETSTGGSRLLYDRSYLALPDAIPISPTMPLREEPFESKGLHPFFKNLLPEGWLLDLTCRKLGLPHSDKFGLLLATGADCMGSVEIVPFDDEAA